LQRSRVRTLAFFIGPYWPTITSLADCDLADCDLADQL
jgi:hypothetical protein